MKRIFISVLIVLISFGFAIANESNDINLPNIKTPIVVQSGSLTSYPVVRVIDGDTIIINKGEHEVTVRIIGVDTPETSHPFKPVEYYGKEAYRFTNNLLKGEKVYLVSDTEQGLKDRYGRNLAYVYRYPDGIFVNAEIIRQGYGKAYTQIPFQYLEEFRKLEFFAKKAEKGLWAPKENEEQKPKEPIRRQKEKTDFPKDKIIKLEVKPQEQKQEIIVYITRTGSKYHRGSCSYLRKSKIPTTLKRAKASGYTPCSRCRPPK